MIDDCKSACLRARSALRHRGWSDHDADDLVQEAFVRLLHYQNDHVLESPEAFLMKVALNLAIDEYRANRTRGEAVSLDNVAIADRSPPLEDALSSKERIARLNICIGRLSAKTRAVFVAHHIHGMTYGQIGRLYSLSISSVEKHVAKAVLMIASYMEGWRS